MRLLPNLQPGGEITTNIPCTYITSPTNPGQLSAIKPKLMDMKRLEKNPGGIMKKENKGQAGLKPGCLTKKDVHNEQLDGNEQRNKQPQIELVNLVNTQDSPCVTTLYPLTHTVL